MLTHIPFLSTTKIKHSLCSRSNSTLNSFGICVNLYFASLRISSVVIILRVFIVFLLLISTHTLTWSVTRVRQSESLRSWISTHTLTWSVTEDSDDYRSLKAISTHTLTWSVTFISVTEKRPSKFQLTRSRGAWPRLSRYLASWLDFNSHAHVERD